MVKPLHQAMVDKVEEGAMPFPEELELVDLRELVDRMRAGDIGVYDDLRLLTIQHNSWEEAVGSSKTEIAGLLRRYQLIEVRQALQACRLGNLFSSTEWAPIGSASVLEQAMAVGEIEPEEIGVSRQEIDTYLNRLWQKQTLDALSGFSKGLPVLTTAARLAVERLYEGMLGLQFPTGVTSQMAREVAAAAVRGDRYVSRSAVVDLLVETGVQEWVRSGAVVTIAAYLGNCPSISLEEVCRLAGLTEYQADQIYTRIRLTRPHFKGRRR